ncbi:AAA family ATPase [Saccharomonospora iraqiensis]|uniref:AAA family ATPase n=1 Tax=Saccharomonospora iraqiensis TaxID=52698 RepID=UPI00022E191D|nr:ATP-binding protein [Saccharomonospora iraqiensis]
MLDKPVDVFDREVEWADLTEFALSGHAGLRIAVVYGRRRQGKSYLLRRLAESTGGLYHLATEQTETIAVRRFNRALASWAGLPEGALGFADWEQSLTGAVRMMADRSGTDAPSLLVLDEFPYLTRETPGLPSILQGLYDEFGPGAQSRQPPMRIVLCGSAISVMSDLLAGTKALRGRGALELRVSPFGFREAREYWGIDDTRTAFRHNALIGGTPGYRELVPTTRVPENPDELGGWLARNVLRPGVPLFDEADRVVHEDPKLRDPAIYGSLMAAIAAGESSPAKIAGLLGRQTSSLTHQLRMLESTGFVRHDQDLLRQRRPVITVADPVVRLHHLVIEPYLADLEAGEAEQVWHEVAHTVASKILGPHFEALATEWVTRFARAEAGLRVGPTGQTTVPCPEHRTGHEVDIVSLRRGARPRTTGAPIVFLGEAKARDRRPGLAELARLDHIRDLLTGSGHDASEAVLGLFSTTGFTDDLVAEAARRGEGVLLVGLDRLYGVA